MLIHESGESEEAIMETFNTLRTFFNDKKELSDNELIGLYAELYTIYSFHESLEIEKYWQSRDRMKFDYLFQGLSLTAIEYKLFKTNDYHGWLSKTFLNYYGIDTEKENKGIYADRSVPDVVDELYKSSNIAHVRVAKLLKEKYL